MLFADDRVLQKLVSMFGKVCERRKMRVNVNKSLEMSCNTGVRQGGWSVSLNGENLEEVEHFRGVLSVVTTGGGGASSCHDPGTRLYEETDYYICCDISGYMISSTLDHKIRYFNSCF